MASIISERVACLSIAPAILIVPIWFFIGRFFLGGAFGWYSVLSFFTVCPVLLVYHCALLGVVIHKNSTSEMDQCTISSQLADWIVLYYGLHIALQFFMGDFGDDDESVGHSAAKRWLLVPDLAASIISLLLFLAILVVMVVVMVFACKMDLARAIKDDDTILANLADVNVGN